MEGRCGLCCWKAYAIVMLVVRTMEKVMGA